MRTMLRGKFTLLFITFGLMLAFPAIALAVDTLSVNDLNTGGDVSKTANSTGTAQIYMTAGDRTPGVNPPDDANNCNADATNKTKVTLTSSDSTKVTLDSPGFVELTGCDVANAKSIGYTVTAAAQPGDVITVSGTATGGKNNSSYTADSFKVTIVAPPEQGTSLSVSPASGTYGGTTSLSATLSSNGSGLANKIVSFTLNGNSVGNATTNSSGVATLPNVSLSGIDAGTYADAVGASYAGTGSGCTANCYGPSNGTATLTVNKAAGSVSIDNIPPPNAVFGGSFTPTYTKAGDGQTSVSSLTTATCTVNFAGVVNFVGAGPCTLQAAVTEGTNHLAATGAEQTFQIAKAQASLSFADGTLSKTYNGDPQSVTVNTNPPGLNGVEITYDGSPNAPTNAGNYTVVASLNNPNYQAQQISGTLVIGKADATIDVQGYEDTYDGAPHGATGSATGVKGEDLSSLLNLGQEFTDVPGGTATWNFAGNDNYKSASGTANIVITKATAQVTLGNLGPHVWDGNAKAATATTTPAGLNVQITYSQNGNAVANPTNVGSYDVLAKVVENNYQGQATGTLVISPWTYTGFYQPVDMSIWNTVKAGSTVPMKFELFQGGTELKDVSAIKSYAHKAVACGALDTTAADAIEITTTGNTSLRFDSTSDQFIFNWKSQSTWKAGTCYVVTVVGQDGTPLNAYFKMK
jgi:MBG domain